MGNGWPTPTICPTTPSQGAHSTSKAYNWAVKIKADFWVGVNLSNFPLTVYQLFPGTDCTVRATHIQQIHLGLH